MNQSDRSGMNDLHLGVQIRQNDISARSVPADNNNNQAEFFE